MADLVPFLLQHETPREAPHYWDRCFNTPIARLRDTSVPLVDFVSAMLLRGILGGVT